jgi:peptide/nickel transport system substrate-binding protein
MDRQLSCRDAKFGMKLSAATLRASQWRRFMSIPVSRSWRARSALAAVALGALALAACSSPSSSSPAGSSGTAAASSGGTLNLGDDQIAPSDYNPWDAGYGINNTLWFSQTLYDSLVTLNANAQPQPSLATAWTQNGNTTTLTLRSGVKFSDGTALNAAAVKANLDYGAAHPAGAECNAYLAGLKTTVLSPTSIRLTTPEPVPGLLQDLGQCAGFIVSPKALANPKSLVSTPDGSGPYTLQSSGTIAGQRYTFTKNPNYWDPSAFPFKTIVLTMYTSTTTVINAVRGGQSDVASNLTSPQLAGVGSSVGQLSGAPDLLAGMWIADTTGTLSKPLGNVLVRQAMNYAINRQALVTGLYKASGEVAGSTPFPSFYTGYSSALAGLYPYDPAKAKQLLAQAGYPNGFSVGAIDSPATATLAEGIAGYLAQVGIKLQISSYSTNFVTEMLTGKFPLITGYYTLNAAQFQTINGIIGPNGFWNPRHNTDTKVMGMLATIQSAPSSQQATLYDQLARQIASDGLLLTPAIIQQITVYSSHVKASAVAGVPVPMVYDILPS